MDCSTCSPCWGPDRLNPFSPPCRYRKWHLNEDEDVDIIVRCELDAAIKVKDEDQLLSVKALNETDLRTQVGRGFITLSNQSI